jgi:hypothetical protein
MVLEVVVVLGCLCRLKKDCTKGAGVPVLAKKGGTKGAGGGG